MRVRSVKPSELNQSGRASHCTEKFTGQGAEVPEDGTVENPAWQFLPSEEDPRHNKAYSAIQILPVGVTPRKAQGAFRGIQPSTR